MKLKSSLLTVVGITMALSSARASLPAAAVTGEPQTKMVDLPAPKLGWLNWERFNKIYVEKLAKDSTSDEQRLSIVKRASEALNQHLMVLTPEQLHRVIATFDKEEAKLEALQELAGSTRYNNSDIPKITSAFAELKNDAHGVLFAIGGYGGY